MTNERLVLFPLAASVGKKSRLMLGGCDCVDLVKRYGSPLYVFDEDTIRSQCKEFVREFGSRHGNVLVAYASKAFANKSLAEILKEEGLGLDTVSGGEISVAQSVGFPAERVLFHGNNKSEAELRMALDWGLGRIVVDNTYELGMLDQLAREKGLKADILLRVNPSVDPHTHNYTTTGILDSKFGLPIGTGQAEQAVRQALSLKSVRLQGLHFHLGSPITETGPYRQGLDVVLEFASEMKSKYSFSTRELSPGGGFPVRYTSSARIPSISEYAETIVTRVLSAARSLGISRLIIEPGRSIVARAGVALYTVGAIKNIPGVRTYACVDGGMGDNIRPALYNATYEAMLANRMAAPLGSKVTIAGRYCESGDILIRDIEMPDMDPGDIVAIPVSGAYCIPMASNYNMVPFPAVAMVRNGRARLIRRRQKYADLLKYDVTSVS